MVRRLLLPLGLFLLAAQFALVAAFGIPDPWNAVRAGLMIAAGGLVVVGALRDEIRIGRASVPWYALVGAAWVLLGLDLLAGAVVALTDGGSTAETAAQIAGGIGGLVLIYIGYDFARGGKHFDLSRAG